MRPNEAALPEHLVTYQATKRTRPARVGLATVLGLSVVCAPAAARADVPSPERPPGKERPRRLGHSFGAATRLDVNVEGGLGSLRDHAGLSGFGRVRVGVLRIVESAIDPNASPLFFTVGATYDASPLSLATLGVQTELTHVASGLWGQFGALVDVTKPEPGFMASLGWNVVGIEAQRRRYSQDSGLTTNDWAVFGKLRIPVSLLFGAF